MNHSVDAWLKSVWLSLALNNAFFSFSNLPLQQLFGQTIRGDNVRVNPNVIRPFSQPRNARARVPLSSATLNPQNTPVLAHLGKPVGRSESLVKNVSGAFKGKGLQLKNNIKLVL
jgi:hypothetical protein